MEFSLVTNASYPFARDACVGLASGKSGDEVKPATTALPPESTAMAAAWSKLLPPTYVLYTRPLPAGFTSVTKA